ncbi:hypothetical protein ANCCAN_24252 [Ancylostoma caninum]|uniref:Uncharacterized protein n=1 Tax=Ancylostoma caninum TaxID=29170 RepID=A0A368FCY3_ANCCA|nr:hypothetical protein ANCCAN_24252 [Ancylostoma caninum]
MTALSTMANMKNEITAAYFQESAVRIVFFVNYGPTLCDGVLKESIYRHHHCLLHHCCTCIAGTPTEPSYCSSSAVCRCCCYSHIVTRFLALLFFIFIRCAVGSANVCCSILDEEELCERAVPFPLEELVNIARFCNYFCFRAVYNGYEDDRLAYFSQVCTSFAYFFMYVTVGEFSSMTRSFGWLRTSRVLL